MSLPLTFVFQQCNDVGTTSYCMLRVGYVLGISHVGALILRVVLKNC